MVICLERGAYCHSRNVCVGSDVVLCQITLTLAVPVAAESTEADVVFCYVLFAGICSDLAVASHWPSVL